MELEEMKQNWDALSDQLKKQPLINEKIIDQMTQAEFRSGLKRITYPERAGIAVCVAGAVFIGWNFYLLDSVFLQAVGIAAILLLLTISTLSFLSILQLNRFSDFTRTHVEILKEFMLKKMKFHQLQRINFIICHLLLLTIVILLFKFFSGKDLADSKSFLIFSFTLGYIFLLFYSKWVLKGYNNALRRTEEALKELQA